MLTASRHYFMLSLLIVLSVLCLNSVSANTTGKSIIQLTIADVIGPATADYVERSLHAAQEQQAELVIIRLDTPGGLDLSMRSIIKNISNSSVPVVTFVAPTGARAASAGTYILYASHVAAMAPGTNLGAATPVQIGGVPMPANDGNKKDKPQDKAPASDMQRKIINDAVAYIQSLAELHGRNKQWAEKAVLEGPSLPATEALKLHVIDIMATGTADLLKQLQGRPVKVQGYPRTLNTDNLSVTQLEPDWRNRFLSVITNPNIAYILMLLGIYGLILEFSNPGSIVPGTIGAICLLLALYSFQSLPINYAGFALILLGVALMVGEAFEPSFGMLGIGGVIAFVIGSIILIDTTVPGFGIDISLIAAFAVSSALIFIFVVGIAIKARRRPVVSGLDELINAEAIVINDFAQQGSVSIHSETWKAQTATPLHKGQRVRVTGNKGLTLTVEPMETNSQEKES